MRSKKRRRTLYAELRDTDIIKAYNVYYIIVGKREGIGLMGECVAWQQNAMIQCHLSVMQHINTYYKMADKYNYMNKFLTCTKSKS